MKSKKVNKYLILVVVLAIILIAETTFVFLDLQKRELTPEKSYINIPKEEDSNSTDDEGDNNFDLEDNQNSEDNSDTILEEDQNSEDSEISNYLSYIPYYLPLDYTAYFEDSNVEDIDQSVLIAMALSQGVNNLYAGECNGEECGGSEDNPIEIKYLYDDIEEPVYGLYYFTLEYINNILETMYNIRLSNLEETTSWDNIYAGAHGGFAFQNNYFLMCSGGIGQSWYHVGFVDDWKIENSELIIYEIAAYRDTYLSLLKDYRNDYEITIDAYFPDEALNALRDNSEHFTRYKHVFKKNDNGYYWYSTGAI